MTERRLRDVYRNAFDGYRWGPRLTLRELQMHWEASHPAPVGMGPLYPYGLSIWYPLFPRRQPRPRRYRYEYAPILFGGPIRRVPAHFYGPTRRERRIRRSQDRSYRVRTVSENLYRNLADLTVRLVRFTRGVVELLRERSDRPPRQSIPAPVGQPSHDGQIQFRPLQYEQSRHDLEVPSWPDRSEAQNRPATVTRHRTYRRTRCDRTSPPDPQPDEP